MAEDFVSRDQHRADLAELTLAFKEERHPPGFAQDSLFPIAIGQLTQPTHCCPAVLSHRPVLCLI
jgi:hypothetical protein